MSFVERFIAAVAAFNKDSTKKADTYGDGRQFSPGRPLRPQYPAQPPYANQFKVGYNLNITPRGEEPKLLPFAMLRQIAESHDLIAICIQMMIDHITGDEWDVVVADKNDREHHEDDILAVKQFFYKPDKVHLFDDWFKPLLYDTLTCDCACFYRRWTRGHKLHSIEVVDGTTIKPLIDQYGRIPQPPDAAYQQILWGVPYGSENAGTAKTQGFTLNEISYRPRYPRSWSRYGYSPIEKLLVKVNIALRRDDYHLKYFTDGTTPDGGIFSFDNPDMTPDQIEQFAQLYSDIMSGDLKERLKLKFLPKGQYINTKQFNYDVKVDEWMARMVALAFGVNPQSFIVLMNRSTAQSQDQQQTEIGLKPLEDFYASWFTDIIQHDLGFPALRFKFVGEKKDDAELSIKRDQAFVESGILRIDEIRSMRGLPPLTDLKDGIPAWVKVGNDIILLTPEYIKAKTKAQLLALTAGNVQGGNQQNTEVKVREAINNAGNPNNAPPGKQPKEAQKVPPQKSKAQKEAVGSELKRFERFSLKRLNKRTSRLFESDVIPEALMKSLNVSLADADSPEKVKAIFQKAEADTAIAVDILAADLASDLSDIESDLEAIIEDLKEDEVPDGKDWKGYVIAALLANIDFGNGDIAHDLRTMLTQYATDAVNRAASDIEALTGEQLSSVVIDGVIKEAVEARLEFLRTELKTATGNFLTSELFKASDKEELKDALRTGYALSSDRAKTIATTEQGYMVNLVRVKAGKASKTVTGVLVSDGLEHDEPCITADGQVWTFEYAMDHLKQHPDCVREFSYVSQQEAET